MQAVQKILYTSKGNKKKKKKQLEKREKSDILKFHPKMLKLKVENQEKQGELNKPCFLYLKLIFGR